MNALADRAVDTFVEAGLAAREVGILPQAAGELAKRLIAEGHAGVLAEVTAAFWSANAGRLARRDRWAAHAATVRAGLDPGEKEPPPPPPPPPPEKPPPPPPTEDRSAHLSAGVAAPTGERSPSTSLANPPSGEVDA